MISGPDIKINSQGFVDKITAVQKRMADITSVMRLPALEMRAMATQSFASRVGPDGVPWAPRVDPRDQSEHILERSVSVEPSRKGLRIRVPLNHASFMLFGRGTPGAPGYSPPRRFLPFTVGKTGRTIRLKTGAAGAWWKATSKRLKDFIRGASDSAL